MEIIKINNSWMFKEEYKNICDFFQKQQDYIFYFYKPEHKIIRKQREKIKYVFAYFMVGNTQILCMTTTNIPSKAFKLNKNYKITNEFWRKAKFIRYCTNMDL